MKILEEVVPELASACASRKSHFPVVQELFFSSGKELAKIARAIAFTKRSRILWITL